MQADMHRRHQYMEELTTEPVAQAQDVQAVTNETQPSNTEPQALNVEKHESEDEKSKGYLKRIAVLTAQREKANREAEFHKQLSASYASKLNVSSSDDSETLIKPDKNAYSDPHDYAEALLEWRLKKEKVDHNQKVAKESAAAQQQAWEAQKYHLLQTHAQRITEFEKQAPDYKQKVMESLGPILNDAHAFAIQTSPRSAEVAYYLANNLEDAYELAAIQNNPLEMGIFVGRITAKLEAQAPRKTLEPMQTITPGRSSSLAGTIDAGEDDFQRLRRQKFKGGY